MQPLNRLGNTERAVLDMVVELPGVRIEAMVLAMWPSTKQPLKKRRTIETYLRSLTRLGYVREVGGVCMPTEAAVREAGGTPAPPDPPPPPQTMNMERRR